VCSVVKIGTQRKKFTSPITTSNRLNRTLMPMHPRTTRGCPLVILKAKNYKLFINNVNSPGFMKPSMFNAEGITLTTDAVTCQRRSGTTVVKNGKIKFCCFAVKFWSGSTDIHDCVFSVDAPAHWEACTFISVFLKDLEKHDVISLVNSFYISGRPFPFNTINTIHHKFGKI
jgi:hypothetical protein